MKSWRFMALPLMIVLAVLGWPIGRAIWTSLHLQSGTDNRSPVFIGLDNYAGVLSSSRWWYAVGILTAWTLIVVLCQLLIGSMMAASLHHLTIVAPVLRVLLVAPFAVVSIAAAAGAVAAVDGGFFAQWTGIESDAGNYRTLGAIGFAEVWRGSGVVALILLAGFARTGSGLLEWLHAEGATWGQRFRRVVLPGLVPAIAFAAAFRIMDTWRGFGQLWAGGLTDLPQFMVFNTAFDRFEYGLASAMAVVFGLLTLALGIVAGLILRWAHTARDGAARDGAARDRTHHRRIRLPKLRMPNLRMPKLRFPKLRFPKFGRRGTA